MIVESLVAFVVASAAGTFAAKSVNKRTLAGLGSQLAAETAEATMTAVNRRMDTEVLPVVANVKEQGMIIFAAINGEKQSLLDQIQQVREEGKRTSVAIDQIESLRNDLVAVVKSAQDAQVKFEPLAAEADKVVKTFEAGQEILNKTIARVEGREQSMRRAMERFTGQLAVVDDLVQDAKVAHEGVVRTQASLDGLAVQVGDLVARLNAAAPAEPAQPAKGKGKGKSKGDEQVSQDAATAAA